MVDDGGACPLMPCAHRSVIPEGGGLNGKTREKGWVCTGSTVHELVRPNRSRWRAHGALLMVSLFGCVTPKCVRVSDFRPFFFFFFYSILNAH